MWDLAAVMGRFFKRILHAKTSCGILPRQDLREIALLTFSYKINF
jgi:hypothetical protein